MTIEAMKQAIENELEISDFIDKAPKSWERHERIEWAWAQAMIHNIRVFKKVMRQAIAEAEKQEPVAWPESMEQPPLYPDEDPAEQARAFRYRAGWNDCLEKCKAATTPQQRKPLTDEQAAFETVFQLPANCTRFEGGYAPTSYNAWDAQTFCNRWEGWKARAAHGIKEST
jgi:hypothetical protein